MKVIRWRCVACLVWLSAALLTGCSGSDREADGAPPVGTAVGERAPGLEGTLATGEPFSLAGEVGAPVVLVFYRGAYCGLCRERLARLQEHLSAYRSLGAQVVAATPDPPEESAALAERLALEFPIVSTDPSTLERWGVGDADRAAARPGTFLVDRDGKVLFRHIGRNAGDRVRDAGLLTLLERRARD